LCSLTLLPAYPPTRLPAYLLSMLSLTFLGTGASIPTLDRNVAGLAVQREGEVLLFDCGEGNQRQMMRYGVGFTFKEIFFTHYHADHMLGVTGLLRTMGLQDRTAPVTLYGPKGAQRVLRAAVELGIERNKFPIEIVEIKAGDRLHRDEYDIVVFETQHRADTVGFALAEHARLGRFNPERARELGIPEGPLWGQLHRGKPVQLPDGRTVEPADLVGQPRPGRTLVYTGDTRPHIPVIEAARGADLLVHEATFGGDELERAMETGHSTAAEAARVALEAGVRQLVLTHISSRYNRDASELLAEARAVFPASTIARDGMVVDVPYADAVSVPDVPV
ncbi:MAG TPA: ribonuclease Z, partial [Gemmatimonadales bacterium]|nr:ribonuclease Z [Gemmatimonadales bacterium]